MYSKDLKFSTIAGCKSDDSKESHKAREAYCINLLKVKTLTQGRNKRIEILPGNFVSAYSLAI